MDKSTADRLQKFRKQNGYSQEELADMLNVSRQAVSKWECGESSPDTENLIALAKIYNVTIDQLLNGTASNASNATITEEQFVAKNDNSLNNLVNDKSDKNLKDNTSEGEDNPLPKKQRLISGIVNSATALLCTALYFIIGLCANIWHPTWVLFMFIPLVTSICDSVIERQIKNFAFPVLVAIVYLLVGFFTNLWHPCWVIFLSIPLYYIVLDIIKLKDEK